MSDQIDAARRWWDAGCTPLPVATDGTKRPAVNTWRQWQQLRPDWDTIAAQFNAIDTDGIGIICGTSSGNLEMVELEGPAIAAGVLAQLAQAFIDHDQADLWRAITTGCAEVTPGGGMHFYLRVGDGPARGNTKLARQPVDGGGVQVLIETRGEGGWSVVAPSSGRSHPTGREWMVVTGGPATIPTVTSEQRDLIHALCGLFDQMPDAEPRTPEPAPTDGRLRPGDDFNARATWAEILEPHGWTLAHRRGLLCSWVRPGKHKRDGISATTGRNDGDNMWVFTSSTTLPTEQPLSKLYVHAHYNFDGDMSAAASALRRAGYGDPSEPATLTLLPGGLSSQPLVEGTAALAPQPAPAVHVFERSEDALAIALVGEHRESLRYCPQRSKWLLWDGAKWSWDDANEHRELIRELARRLPAPDKPAAEFRRRALSANGVSAIARLAETDRRTVVHIDSLDSHPWQLNTPAGAIDLRTGQLLPPNPMALHTRSTTVAPDFAMPAPVWLKFLSDTFGGDPGMIAFIQRLLGVAVVGEVLEQVLPFAFGSGANGKTTLMDAVQDVLGRGERGYAISAQPEMLMHRRHSEHPAEIAQLAGARMVIASELEDGARFAEARIKQLTGGDAINARFMRENPFTFTPSHTIFLIANHKPMATVGGPAFWRRLLLLPFAHIVPDTERDPELPTKLKDEAPAILAWIAAGAAAYAANGLQVPPSVRAATADYQRQEDSVGRFVDEQCHLATGSTVVQTRVSEVRAAYEQMCRELGDEPVSSRRLTQELRGRWGVESVRSNGVRYYAGVALVEYAQDDDESEDELPIQPGWPL